MKLATVALLSALMVGCGYGSSYNSTTGTTSGTPKLSALSPSSITAGGAAFTLTLTGSNFTTGSTVYWGTTALAGGYGSGTQVTAAISATMIANPGSVSVYVHSAGGNSNSMTFTIN